MNHTQFFSAVKAGEIARCYLFSGQEMHVARSALDALRGRLLPPGLEALNESLLHAPHAGEVVAACETLPMMGEKRLVVVMDSPLLLPGKARDEVGESERLTAYLPQIPDSTCLVFFVQGAVDGRKRLTTALQKQAVAIRFEPLGDGELAKWILTRLKRFGIAATPALAAQLAFTSGRDLTQLSGEIDKLAAYLGDRKELTVEDIERVATRSMECTIFQLVDAIVARQEAQAFSLYHSMLEHGESRLGILAMLLRQLRLLRYIRRLTAEGMPQGAQQKVLGMQGFAYTRALSQLRRFTDEQLEQGVSLCLETDFAVKSGRMREEMALDRVILILGSQKSA